MAKVSDFDYGGELMGDYLTGATIDPNIILLICASVVMRILWLTSQGARRRREQAEKSLFHVVLGGRKSRSCIHPRCVVVHWNLHHLMVRWKKKRKKKNPWEGLFILQWKTEISFGYNSCIVDIVMYFYSILLNTTFNIELLMKALLQNVHFPIKIWASHIIHVHHFRYIQVIITHSKVSMQFPYHN